MRAQNEIARLALKLRSLNMSPEEPLFTLRAQDELASATVRFWCSLATAAGVPRDKINEALDLAVQMDNFPVKQTPGKPETRRTL